MKWTHLVDQDGEDESEHENDLEDGRITHQRGQQECCHGNHNPVEGHIIEEGVLKLHRHYHGGDYGILVG